MNTLDSTLVQVSNAGVEPVTVATAKDWLRVETDDENDLIGLLISAAREYAESFCRRSFLPTEVWALTMDSFPWATLRDGGYFHEFDYSGWQNAGAYLLARPDRLAIEIPMGPVQAINSITYLDGTGLRQTLSGGAYTLLADPEGETWVYPAYGTSWPTTQAQPGAVVVTFTAGTATCPYGVILAIQQMVAHWYVNREAVVMVSGVVPQEVPFAAKFLLWPHRNWEL